ncbi:MAG: 30S ribosomal protein S16 [Candidatus Taylorbacteria bacterium RIFCSPLOWO2_01_FULL_44_26]|uniref:30S ribosomal protein S16 n=2 Tax=Candidatus Tayloriibacteriota TaxID=1817919 RepID=A0A1G2MK87_9BACT|nr:MAG: 30S ribosomal protein S16 [Candidatus Taylorbacteria bacterium RIFCSPHIGHO2_02_FULL_44_12]OHA30979.1 MAG: 30S ribosomal protein S16 [Candidatus Taylorbacteria bacterium RIFCSPLOWO2_01_FULL_44_26]
MLTIRLQRTGRKHEPTFRVVLTESKNGPKSGKYLENLGWYDTRLQNKAEQVDADRLRYWISKGAGVSLTLHNFLVSTKIIEGKKKNALPKKTFTKKEEVKAPEPVPTEVPSSEPVPASEPITNDKVVA